MKWRSSVKVLLFTVELLNVTQCKKTEQCKKEKSRS